MATLGTFVTGQVLTAAELNAIGTYTSYSPTLGGVTVGNGTKSFAYTAINKFVHFQGRFTFGTTSSVSGTITISLPVTSNTPFAIVGAATGADYTVGTYSIECLLVDANTAYLYYINTAGATPNLLATSATAPFTWGNQDFFEIDIYYRAA